MLHFRTCDSACFQRRQHGGGWRNCSLPDTPKVTCRSSRCTTAHVSRGHECMTSGWRVTAMHTLPETAFIPSSGCSESRCPGRCAALHIGGSLSWMQMIKSTWMGTSLIHWFCKLKVGLFIKRSIGSMHRMWYVYRQLWRRRQFLNAHDTNAYSFRQSGGRCVASGNHFRRAQTDVTPVHMQSCSSPSRPSSRLRRHSHCPTQASLIPHSRQLFPPPLHLLCPLYILESSPSWS